VLRSLPPTWTTVRTGRGPAPAGGGHVVVGPGGVFVVQDATRDGDPGGADPVRAARAADAVRRVAGPDAGRVVGVLLVPGAAAPGEQSWWVGDVLVCSATDLPRVLTGRPVVLSPGDAAQAAIRLEVRLRVGAVDRVPSAVPTLPATPARRAVRRALAVLVAVLVLLVVLLLAVVGTHVADGLGQVARPPGGGAP
jgi:hypothetical protein